MNKKYRTIIHKAENLLNEKRTVLFFVYLENNKYYCLLNGDKIAEGETVQRVIKNCEEYAKKINIIPQIFIDDMT